MALCWLAIFYPLSHSNDDSIPHRDFRYWLGLYMLFSLPFVALLPQALGVLLVCQGMEECINYCIAIDDGEIVPAKAALHYDPLSSSSSDCILLAE